MNPNPSRRLPTEALILGVFSLILVLTVAHSRPAALRNAGFVELNHATVTSPPIQSTLQSARLRFERALEVDNTSSSAVRGLGLTLGLGDQVEAATAILQTQPISDSTLFFLGDHYRQAQDYGRAQVWYEEAVAFAPENALAWQRLGLVHELQGNLDAARSAYSEAWRLDKSLTARHLARILEDAADFATAEKVLLQAIDEIPESEDRANWWVQLGDLRRAEGRIPEAITTYQLGLAEYPNNPYLHLGLGQSYLDSNGSVDQALQEFYLANKNEDLGLSAFAIAELLNSQREFAESWPWYERAVQLNPNNPRWIAAYVNSARVGGNLDLALKIGEPASIRFGDYGPLYSQLAAVYQESEDWEKAVEAIRRALDHIPDPSSGLLLRAGRIFEQAGSADEARDAFQAVLNRNPDDSLAQAGLSRLIQATETPDE